MTREQELEAELRHILTLLDWGSLDGPQYQAYWRCKLLVGTPSEQQWARRKLDRLAVPADPLDGQRTGARK